MPIRISLGTLVKFMTSGPAMQNKTIHEAKYPASDESRAQAQYHRELRDRVRIHHGQHKPVGWLSGEATGLRTRALTEPKQRTRTRLGGNADALDFYEQHFGNRPFVVQQGRAFTLTFNGVEVRVTPDLIVQENSVDKLVRLYPNVPPPPARLVPIVCQAMFEAAQQAGWPGCGPMTKQRVVLLDVHRGTDYSGAQMGARMRADIAAACQQIAALWPTL